MTANRLLFVTALIALSLPEPARAEISGPCSQAVGTYLTENTLDNGGRGVTSQSLLALTNGGHALRFDSDEQGAALNYCPFGDSARTWRCDGVGEGGTFVSRRLCSTSAIQMRKAMTARLRGST